MELLKIYLEFLKIGGFSFGGGLSTLPYIYELSQKTNWITEEYIANILTVSQVTPGPLACNIGTIVGYKVNGIPGSILANLGFITPAICFMSIAYKLFDKIKSNNKAQDVIKTVRSGALSVMVISSVSLFKSAFLLKTENININNFLNFINYKAIILGISLFIFLYLTKNKKINSFLIMLISSVIAVALKI